MKVEVLYFDGCPTYRCAEKTLRDVLADKGMEADVELVAVNSSEEAQRLRFPGSPTVRVDGRDLFLAPELEDWRLGCRVYMTPEGLRGSPTAEMIEEALTKIGVAGATAISRDHHVTYGWRCCVLRSETTTGQNRVLTRKSTERSTSDAREDASSIGDERPAASLRALRGAVGCLAHHL